MYLFVPMLLGAGLAIIAHCYHREKNYSSYLSASNVTHGKTSHTQQHHTTTSHPSQHHTTTTTTHHPRNIAKNQAHHKQHDPVRHYHESEAFADSRHIRAGLNRPYSQSEIRHHLPERNQSGQERMNIPHIQHGLGPDHNIGGHHLDILSDSRHGSREVAHVMNEHSNDTSPIRFKNENYHDRNNVFARTGGGFGENVRYFYAPPGASKNITGIDFGTGSLPGQA